MNKLSELKRKKLSWKPVRRGVVYCSPACGGGCTMAAFLDAHKKARALVLKMGKVKMGKHWRADVWENLGWHYAVVSPCGGMRISPSYLGTPPYSATFMGHFTAHSANPKTAASDAILKASLQRTELSTAIIKFYKNTSL